jgi:hypothetical protein
MEMAIYQQEFYRWFTHLFGSIYGILLSSKDDNLLL